MKYIKRDEIKDDYFREMLQTETHHDHKIVSVNGTYRWEQNKTVNALVNEMDLNNLMYLFDALGFDRNSETIRKLYRNMGYSLYGYWEIFYWETNNPLASEYVPNQKA